jgi:hypothetical protein
VWNRPNLLSPLPGVAIKLVWAFVGVCLTAS